ncbi:MAG: glycosyltransferase, partial [Lachnospiraceae bacterium]|nr:glycosyltransferase [Lachnospiraceae bacterium]
MHKQPLLNTYASNLTMSETVSMIDRFISEKKKSYIVAINVDVVMKIEKDDILKKITDNADIVLTDG